MLIRFVEKRNLQRIKGVKKAKSIVETEIKTGCIKPVLSYIVMNYNLF